MPNASSNPDLAPGVLMRLAADGELTSEQHARLEAHLEAHPEDRARIESEVTLRQALGRALSEPGPAPADLRNRLTALFAAEPVEPAQTSEIPHSSPIATPLGDTTQRSFWAGIGRLAAIAAVLAICATAIFIAGRPYFGGGAYSGPESVQVASFLRSEHDRCAIFSDQIQRKLIYQTPEEARQGALELFEAMPEVLTSHFQQLQSQGLHFAGFGRCAVPGPGRSGHLLFIDTNGGHRAVSLFIQVDDGSHQSMQTDCCYVRRPADPEDPNIVVWRADGFLYYLVTPNGEVIKAARQDFHIPADEHRYF